MLGLSMLVVLVSYMLVFSSPFVVTGAIRGKSIESGKGYAEHWTTYWGSFDDVR
ncbi:hypothetical protein CY34DRAFT_800310 [Suillus luteus UH-Slu-Lm8-n1]|uniref:Uncharacterized protein n=1 Tax=Suillus luteus UH-Slu-Lm8-n1 TaxID=930992 RepID=A0A0D0BA74_9AGAM|nr:hypothetical protein CY34DRAFT_800310 [Suillus luteus UH-Slu-Lm8-n1]